MTRIFDNQKMKEIEGRIEETREILNHLMKEEHQKSKEKILKVSMQLDELINMYMKMKG